MGWVEQSWGLAEGWGRIEGASRVRSVSFPENIEGLQDRQVDHCYPFLVMPDLKIIIL